MQREMNKGRKAEKGEYIGVRFKGDGTKKWDSKEVEFPGRTVVMLREWTEERPERAEVHWPGKRVGERKKQTQ